MSYLFGDSTPSPFRINFVEFLRLAMGFSVHALGVERRVLAEQTRRIQLEEETEKDRHQLEQLLARLTKTIEDGSAIFRPRVTEHADQIQTKSREIVEAGLQSLAQALKQSLGEIEQHIRAERKSSLSALEKVLLVYNLPEAKDTTHVRLLEGGRYSAWLKSETPYGLETVVELAIPADSVFAHDARVDRLVEGLEIRSPETAGWIRKENRMVSQKLGRFHIVECTLGEECVIKLRSSPEAHASGYDLSIHAEEPRLRIVKIGKDAEGSGAFDPDPSDLPQVMRLREKLEEAALLLSTKRRALTSATIGETPVEESADMRALIERLVQVLAPMVRELSAHSLSPGELVLRRMMSDDRREEIFVTKAELWAILDPLNEGDHRIFTPLELEPTLPQNLERRVSLVPSRAPEANRPLPEANRALDADRDPPSGIKRSNRPPPLRSGVGGLGG